MCERPRLIAWADPGQEALIGDAIEEAGLELIAVGSTSAAGSAALSEGLGVERARDLRVAAQRDDVDLLWLAAPAPIDADERRVLRDLDLRTVSTEPRPMSIEDLRREPDEARTAVFVPLLRRSPGYLAATEALAEFGDRRSVNVAFGAGPGEGTLFARLFDAMDVLESLCGPAETVDAALASAVPGVPESLADLHGHLTVNVRYAESRSACVSASNGAGSWFRRVIALGPAGCLRIDDTGYEWIGADGVPVESSAAAPPLSAGRLAGRQIARLLGNLETGAAPPPENVRLLSLCEAIRLSARTGQGETPARLLEMRSRL